MFVILEYINSALINPRYTIINFVLIYVRFNRIHNFVLMHVCYNGMYLYSYINIIKYSPARYNNNHHSCPMYMIIFIQTAHSIIVNTTLFLLYLMSF